MSTARGGWGRDAWVTLGRWGRKTRRAPTATVLEVIVGVLSLVLFGAVFGDVSDLALAQAGYSDVAYVTYLLPAVMIQVALASAFTAGMGLVEDLESGMIDRVRVTPMAWSSILVGKTTADLVRIAIQVLAVTGVGVLLGAELASPVGAVAAVGVAVLVGALFVSIANVVGVLTRDDEALNAASMLVMFPLLFLSPAFVPVSEAVEPIAAINPVTYGVDAIRALVLDRSTATVVALDGLHGPWATVVPSVAILLGANLLAGAVAIWLLERTRQSDVRT